MARTVLILYEHFTNSVAHMGKQFWSGIFEDDLTGYDINPKSELIKSCKKDGYNYKVLRQHRDGTRSVVESWAADG